MHRQDGTRQGRHRKVADHFGNLRRHRFANVFRGLPNIRDDLFPFFRDKRGTYSMFVRNGLCGKIRAMKSHKATGRPRGRPASIPWDLSEKIMCDLESRLDKATNTVRPDWKGMARRLHVSRSTISREVASLRNSGFIESIYVPIRKGSRTLTTLYRIKRSAQ